jgi:hypothetical protein
VLEAATAAASEKLYDLLVDRCGSHVVRALLAALAGRAVEPARIGGSGGPGGGTGPWQKESGPGTISSRFPRGV